MRGTVVGLPSPYRIADLLPGVYREEDPFIQRFTAGLDDTLAPVLSTLDNLDAYLDPYVTPPDFLEWLGGWVGAVIDETTPLPVRRAAVSRAAELHRSRGTATGLRELVELLTGGRAEVTDSGGVGYAETPGAPPPGDPVPWLSVRVVLPPGADPVLATSMVEAAVAAAKPAHVPHSVEVLTG
jgi:phage tail-like protein